MDGFGSAATSSPQPQGILTLLSSDGHGWPNLRARFCQAPPGRTKVSGSSWHRVSLHFGPAVNADCRCDGRHHRRRQLHGDADFIPAGLDGEWEDDAACTILRLYLDPAVVREAAEAISADSSQVASTPRFQLRDRRIEHVGWALKAELELSPVSDRLFIESLARALAVRLVRDGGGRPGADGMHKPTLTARQLRRLQEFIEANLTEALTLRDLAAVLGMSVSHVSSLFRQTTGTSLHQYVIRRRVESAQRLLRQGQMAVSEVALAAGFADQSHLSRSMRRVLGVSPRSIMRLAL